MTVGSQREVEGGASAFLLAISTKLASRIVPDELTFGVEQEFFLVDGGGRTATDLDARRFFAQFNAPADCEGFPRAAIAGHVLKPEYWPHLLEVAFAPCLSNEVAAEVDRVFTSLDRAARTVGLEVHHSTMLPPGSIRQHKGPVPASQRRLLDSRRTLAESAGLAGNPEFTSNLASTQVSVGGVRWWEPGVLEGLYDAEPETELHVLDLLGLGAAERADLRRRRHLNYLQVFAGLEPLLFPSFDEPFVEAWAAAMVNQPARFWSNSSPTGSIWSTRRDLSLIRPREFGPVEFRGGACMNSVSQVVAAAKLRQAQVERALGSPVPEGAVAAARERWGRDLFDMTRSRT